MDWAFASVFLSAVARITAKVVLIRLRGILTMAILSKKKHKIKSCHSSTNHILKASPFLVANQWNRKTKLKSSNFCDASKKNCPKKTYGAIRVILMKSFVTQTIVHTALRPKKFCHLLTFWLTEDSWKKKRTSN